MSTWIKTIGTQTGRFILGLAGVSLKNNSGTAEVRNNGDTEYAPLTSETIELHNNTAGFSNTFRTQDTQAADYVYDWPLDDGSPNQVLTTDGAGLLTWESAGSNADSWKVDSTPIAFGSSATVSMFTLPANSVIERVSLIVDTAFDGTPTLSVGVNGGSASKYMGSGDNLLSVTDRYDVPNQSIPNGSTEDLEIAYSAGGATVGAGRVLVTYAVPA